MLQTQIYKYLIFHYVLFSELSGVNARLSKKIFLRILYLLINLLNHSFFLICTFWLWLLWKSNVFFARMAPVTCFLSRQIHAHSGITHDSITRVFVHECVCVCVCACMCMAFAVCTSWTKLLQVAVWTVRLLIILKHKSAVNSQLYIPTYRISGL